MAKIIASILIPTYNSEKFIKPTIESVIKQNFDPRSYEIIFVDDGSTDETIKILKDYKKKFANLKTVFQQNQGTAGAYNRLLKEAQGNYLFIMSHDCIAKDYWLKDVVAKFEKDEKLAIVQGKLLPTRPIDLATFHCNNFSTFQVTFDTAEVAYRASAIDEVGRFFREDFSINGHDADLAWRIIEKGYKYLWLDKTLMYHDVLPRAFSKDIKSYYLMQFFPKLLKIHPGMRKFMKFGLVWGSLFKYVFVFGLLISVFLFISHVPLFSLILFLLTLLFSAFRVLRSTVNYKLSLAQKIFIVLPHRIICETLLGVYLIYGSIKYRSLVI